MAYFADLSDSGLPPHWDMAKSLLANCTTILLGVDKGSALAVTLVAGVMRCGPVYAAAVACHWLLWYLSVALLLLVWLLLLYSRFLLL